MSIQDSHPSNVPVGIEDLDRQSIDYVLTTTRAVRRRLDLDRPVPLDIVEEFLNLALQAPTGFNMQRWRWLVITEPKIRAAIGEIFRRIDLPFLEMTGQEVPDDADVTRRVAASSRHLADRLGAVPVHVIPCTTHSVREEHAMWEELGYDTDLWNMAASTIYSELWPAVWSFMLALRSRGLGSSSTMIHLGDEPEVADLPEIPDDVSQAGLIPVAYYEGEDFRGGARRPLEDVAFYDRWRQPSEDGR